MLPTLQRHAASLHLCSSSLDSKQELWLSNHTDPGSAVKAACQQGNFGQALSLGFLDDEIKAIIPSLNED